MARWITVWPESKVPAQKLTAVPRQIENCPHCQTYFGWSVCRAGEYKKLTTLFTEAGSFLVVSDAIIGSGQLTVLAQFYERSDADAAVAHLRGTSVH